MRIWIFLLVLVLATLAGIYIRQEPGYALFAYKDWTLEMPLWLSAILIIFLLAACLFLFWTLNTFLSSGHRIRLWWFKNKQLMSRRNTAKGLLELTEGHWQKAERYLKDAARFSDTPLINYLSAAKAAEEGGAYDRRDRYLQLAYDSSGDSDIAVRLTEADLRYKQGDVENSIKILQKLQSENPKHPQVLRLLASIYEETQNWNALYDLLPLLRKVGIFSSKEAQYRLEQKVYQALLPIKAKQGKDAVIKFWHHAPSSVQQSKDLMAAYAETLIQTKAYIEAESLLRTALKKEYDAKLCYLYGLVKGPSPIKQMNFAETLLKENHQDPRLLLTLGCLSFRNQLWGKAKDYLESSIAIEPKAETYALLGQLMDRLGFPAKRDEYYQKGLFSVIPKET